MPNDPVHHHHTSTRFMRRQRQRRSATASKAGRARMIALTEAFTRVTGLPCGLHDLTYKGVGQARPVLNAPRPNAQIVVPNLHATTPLKQTMAPR
jgi:hypothetical protein